MEHRACILFEVVDAPLAGLLLRDESDGQGVERGQHVDLHETQEDHDGDDDGRALGDEERDDQQDQAWDLSERSGRFDGAPHAVAQARAGRRPGGGGRGVDAVHHGLSDLVDGLEHELAVLGGGEHEDEFEHRHGDELDAQLPVPVGPGADPGDLQHAHDSQDRAGDGFDCRAGDGQAQLVHARVVFGGGLQQVGHDVVADAGPYRVEDADDEIDRMGRRTVLVLQAAGQGDDAPHGPQAAADDGELAEQLQRAGDDAAAVGRDGDSVHDGFLSTCFG